VPHITTRKVSVRIQDFCNLLGGGLTSLSTIHADTVAVLGNMSAGAVICVYTFDPADVQVVEKTEATGDAADLPVIFDEVPEKKAVKMDEAVSEEAVDATKGTTSSLAPSLHSNV
jgi:septal ring-binding cell division protein DamX